MPRQRHNSSIYVNEVNGFSREYNVVYLIPTILISATAKTRTKH